MYLSYGFTKFTNMLRITSWQAWGEQADAFLSVSKPVKNVVLLPGEQLNLNFNNQSSIPLTILEMLVLGSKWAPRKKVIAVTSLYFYTSWLTLFYISEWVVWRAVMCSKWKSEVIFEAVLLSAESEWQTDYSFLYQWLHHRKCNHLIYITHELSFCSQWKNSTFCRCFLYNNTYYNTVFPSLILGYSPGHPVKFTSYDLNRLNSQETYSKLIHLTWKALCLLLCFYCFVTFLHEHLQHSQRLPSDDVRTNMSSEVRSFWNIQTLTRRGTPHLWYQSVER